MSVVTSTLNYEKLEDKIKHIPVDHPGRKNVEKQNQLHLPLIF